MVAVTNYHLSRCINKLVDPLFHLDKKKGHWYLLFNSRVGYDHIVVLTCVSACACAPVRIYVCLCVSLCVCVCLCESHTVCVCVYNVSR